MDGSLLLISPPSSRHSSARSGYGLLELQRIGEQTRLVRSLARQPLKFLAPLSSSPAAWIYATTLGGGLVAGDQIHIDLSAGEKTTTFLTTQSATKVYRAIDGRRTSQSLHATLEANALLIAWPDPIICFESAIYEQHQRFDLHPCANLVVVDWQLSGRRAMGERWAFSRYQSRNEICVEQRQILNDNTLLDQANAPLDDPFRTGRFECLATILLTGPALAQDIEQITRQINAIPLSRRASLLCAVSQTPAVTILRIAAEDPQSAAQKIRTLLEPLTRRLGPDPWPRKW